MTTEFRVLVVDPSADHPADPELSLLSLRDAVLGHPSLALEALRYALGSAEQIEAPHAVGGGGPLPPDTPVFKMLLPDQAALLSTSAKKLTKADLLELQGPGATRKLKELQLSFEDLKSVEEAFHQRFAVSGLEEVQEMLTDNTGAGDVAAVDLGTVHACCCCPPCCCCTAAAVPSPLAPVA